MCEELRKCKQTGCCGGCINRYHCKEACEIWKKKTEAPKQKS